MTHHNILETDEEHNRFGYHQDVENKEEPLNTDLLLGLGVQILILVAVSIVARYKDTILDIIDTPTAAKGQAVKSYVSKGVKKIRKKELSQ